MTILEKMTLLEEDETIYTMESAGEQRLIDGIGLCLESPATRIAGAYLLGYSTECLLKAAIGRLNGLPVADSLIAWLRARYHGYQLHDTLFLYNVCVGCRTIPLNTALESEFRTHIELIKNSHEVRLRYKTFQLSEGDVEKLFASTSWVSQNYNTLWR